ncbi:putative mediator of RNA polymerase II transcription subunit 26 isoform X2 [Atheta coriaria]
MVKKGNAIDTAAMLREMEARKKKACCSNNKENTPVVQCSGQTGPMPNMGSANIDKIIQFIEGGPQDEAAYKKAQKKARQKQKKDEERKQREEEEAALRKAEEERIRREQQLAEQQRVKEELALQKQLKKLNQKKKQQQPAQPPPSNDSKSKKKKGKQQQQQPQPAYSDPEPDPEPELFEQTIPAMVTIKRIVENNNSPPTVTITLKGSTPDQDKLLYTLVNGHDAPIITSRCPQNENDKQTQPQQQQQKKQNSSGKQTNDKQKKKKATNVNVNTNNSSNPAKNKPNESVKQVQTSEIKVQLAIDSSFRKDLNSAAQKSQKQKQTNNNINNNNTKSVTTTKKTQEVKTVTKEVKKQQNTVNSGASTNQPEIIDIPSIKLPPGITITKVSGPLTNRKSSTSQPNEYPDVPVSKSGVIVVDTEKLIQQQTATATTGKKKKKKSKKTASVTIQNGGTTNEPRVLIKSSENVASVANVSAPSSSGMVTLKNPIFHPLTGMGMHKPAVDEPTMMNMNEQATISHGENGMVTIRRPRPVGFMPSTNESSISDYLAQNANAATNSNMAATIVTTAPSTPAPATAVHAQAKNPPILTPWQMPDTSFSALSEERKIIRPPSPRGVQWPRADMENGKIATPSVLQGLPGIEITRVRTGSPAVEAEYVEPPANVSIIRTGGYNTDNPKSWAYSASAQP